MIGKSLAFVLVALAILASIGPALSGSRYSFRDVNHFYLPLYQYVGERNADEWLPLWNPLDHTGMPLVGETSTAVLYPVRYAIYRLPITPTSAMNAYLVFHLLLASATSAWLAKRIGCGPLGVAASGLIYPLSGTVFSLVSNPPFLVGAAWLPLALAFALGHGTVRLSPPAIWKATAISSFALAMMVLAGDPQMALHSTLIVAGVVAARYVRSFVPGSDASKPRPRTVANQTLLIGVSAAVLALGASAIQIAASIDWSRQSERVGGADNRTDQYDFSLAPWHTAELVTPRPYGHPFPINRWLPHLIAAEGRMWTPSVYAGIVVGIALWLRLLQPRRYFEDPWFALAVISLLLCLGHFGLVWWLQQIPGVLESSHSAIGGLYWLLCETIPGYDSFRYPVKWLPVFSIASTLVTARWLDSSPRPCERRGLVVLIAIIGTALFATHALLGEAVHNGTLFGNDVPSDEYWGPLDVEGGLNLARWSWCLSLAAILLAWVLREGLPRTILGRRSQTVRLIWLVFIAIDCGLNARTLFPTIDAERERRLAHQASPPTIVARRTLRTQAGMWPAQWRTSSSPQRALEVAASERMAWFGRWHLAEHHAVFNSMVSIRSRSYAEFWQAVSGHITADDPEQQQRFWKAAREWLGIEGVSHVEQDRSISAEGLSLVFVDRRRVRRLLPARVVSRWKPIDTVDSLVAQIAHTGQAPLPHVPLAPPRVARERNGEWSDVSSRSMPQWKQVDPQTFEIECHHPCLLERCVYQDGNWTADLTEIRRQTVYRASVLPSSGLNQAVWIPAAGTWRVRFVYHPGWLLPAQAITVVFWIIMAFLFLAPHLAGIGHFKRTCLAPNRVR